VLDGAAAPAPRNVPPAVGDGPIAAEWIASVDDERELTVFQQ